MTLNYIWLRFSSSKDLGSEEYHFAITSRSTLTWSSSMCSALINMSDRFIWMIGEELILISRFFEVPSWENKRNLIIS